ncbi:MAG: TolC family outer membrane protein [Burkholderiales bacterium]
MTRFFSCIFSCSFSSINPRILPMRRIAASLLGAGLLAPVGNAFALGLLEAYNAALQNDPIYHSAIHESDAGKENRTLGRSNLLPNLSINYSGNKNWAETTQPNGNGGYASTKPIYISSTGGLTLRQPLYSPEGVARYREGIAQSDYSEAQFSARKQELVIRLVSAYVDALYAGDLLNLASAQRDTFAEQKQANDRMFKRGEGTRTDMLETQAKLDLAEAQLIEAKDSRATSFHALAAIVGSEVNRLDGLSENFQARPLQPAAFEDWKQLALQHNPDIQAQRYAVEVAQQEIYKNRAGQLPHLDLVASVTKDKADTIDTYTTNSNVGSLGVQLTIPIYSGGSVSASTRQASANYEKAKTDLEDKSNQTLLDLHKQHYAALSSLAKIDALVKSVKSAKLLITATMQSIKGGVRVNLDLLNAKQQLYLAQRDLAQARYSYLLADLKLRADAGVLSIDNLYSIAGYFVASR